MSSALPQIEKFENQEMWIERALEILKEQVLLSQKDFHIALAGGATPLPIYSRLRDVSLPWNRISFYQTDERVTHDQAELNLTTQLASLGKNLLLTTDKFVTFNTDLPINEMMNSFKKSLPDALDLAIIGMGEDGHIMSLFDQADLELPGVLVETHTEQYTSRNRVGLTFNYLQKTKHILLLLQGAKKLEQLNLQLSLQTNFRPVAELSNTTKLEILYLA